MDLAERITGVRPAGCQCGRCEVMANGLVVRCAGTSVAMGNRDSQTAHSVRCGSDHEHDALNLSVSQKGVS